MKISYNWLSNYLTAMPTTDELAQLLTAVGLEVEDQYAYESIKGGLSGVVVGEVLTCEKHPGADKLKVTTVNVGAAEALHIVCGAPNVAAGQKVPVAVVGTTLYPSSGEPITLKRAKIRGEESEGMICAEDELGIGSSHAGILVLPKSTPVGTPVAGLFGVYTDTIYEIGLTPNRSDAFSHYGVAREVAAYMQLHHAEKNIQLKPYPESTTAAQLAAAQSSTPITVNVVATEACPRYCGLLLNNVKVGDSPAWLQNYLKSIGLRPINNVVDITNYVLHESGQPLHAFDAEKIAGQQLIIRRAQAAEKFVTLDQQEVALKENDLLIADKEQGLCIAGVMGGSNSGVTAHTQQVFLESAWFQPSTVRTTSTRLNLRTDAALHFEKRIDVEMAPKALLRAAALLIEVSGASIGSSLINTRPEPFEAVQLQIRYAKINALIGVVFTPQQVKTILTQLGFEIVEETAAHLLLKVPSHKTDIQVEADIIEEIVRLYGLDNIPMPAAVTATIPIQQNETAAALREQVANMLAAQGFNEMLNNSLTRSAYYEDQTASVKLLNSINTELDQLRQNLIFGGLEVIRYNLNRRQLNQSWFEMGKVYSKKENEYVESDCLQLLSTGLHRPKNWQSNGIKGDFFWLKEAVSKVLAKCGVNDWSLVASTNALYQTAFEITVKKQRVGTLGEIANAVRSKFDIKQAVYSAELDWQALAKINAKKQIRYQEVSKYPSVQRDLALVVATQVTYEQIEKTAAKMGGSLLLDMDLFDIYEDKKLGENKKSYAVSMIFQDAGKTLTDDKIDGLLSRMIGAFEKELGAEIRK